MAFLPAPEGLAFEEWGGYLVEQFAEFIVAEVPDNEDEWKDWGNRLQRDDVFSQIPNTDPFDTWRDWARRVVEVMEDA